MIKLEVDLVEQIPQLRRMSATERAKEKEEINSVVSGKNLLVTGGANGLGSAFVKVFLQHDINKVTIIDVDNVKGQMSASAINKTAGYEKATYIRADVTKHEEMIDAFKKSSEAMDGIDIVINNAGILDERRWEREIAVNINGNVSCALLAIEHMAMDKGGRGGVLINVAQHCNSETSAQLPIYTATKWATIGFSKALGTSHQFEKKGIRIITLCPGLTETALTIDGPNKLLSRVMKADFVKNLEQLPIQTPFAVAKGLMTILCSGEHGSIWVIENGAHPYEACIPEPQALRRTFKDNYAMDQEVQHVKKKLARDNHENTQAPIGLATCG
ncbi:15-hydroxyprostaglandin dehydrogenase [NAD(+)] isoform X1 [Neodiprion lecontei]|uniref:15-hydroxyprostaglandin dehydrogenase [NAD(+)] isoform X1 n=2 Tax=Neodiprion lecontei TaxID=441921 RepID=A0A6J0BMU8_NEOLC|nr:15-hydroxyprostaglandin dehydrogenase [NAD(+)] isoform X1 [Neodiprion lecontei]